jgi:S-disulfanyl-L-cysteine oxidoreductase SoxD
MVRAITAGVLAAAFLLLAAIPLLSAQGRTADQGVYTAAQAARGASVYDVQCATCHRENGVAPLLTGERFTRSFSDATLLNLFTTIKTTMPRQAPASLSDTDYTDIVAHLLRLNGYPDGMAELTNGGLESIRIPGQTGNLEFALIQVAGCLAQGPGRAWTLSAATEPVRTREPEPASDDEAAQIDAKPAGNRVFRLQQVYGTPSGWTNQRVAAKGFLTRSGSEERINVTSLRPLTSLCRN